ncbi:Abi family protein [Kaistia adipata]|uniref:Abi family protein n=1 Tax=Kaistia adipata TaxID=166954 RepID=UPI0012EB887F|nr:Abi family protein [Kaistia adipata]
MQLPNSPAADKFPTIVAAIQHERLMRYMPAAGNRVDVSFSYYIWNCKLSESFHPVLHYAEIVCRNAFNRALIARAGDHWFRDNTFLAILDHRFRDDLQEAVASETKQHSDRLTAHHIVSALTFGFWEHLATKRFERYLWAKGVQPIFPCATKAVTREEIQLLIEGVRRWRNRIAHHRAIFDKGPARKHNDALELIGLVCGDTRDWVRSMSTTTGVIQGRPSS